MTNEEIVCRIQHAIITGEREQVRDFWEILYAKNLGLLKKITGNFKKIYAKCEEDKEDIDAEAIVAFWKSVCTYDGNKGAVSTWIYNQISCAMLIWVRHIKGIRFPEKLQILVNQYNAIVNEYMHVHDGEKPKKEFVYSELNKKVKVSRERFKTIQYAKEIQDAVILSEEIEDIVDDRTASNMEYKELNSSPVEIVCMKKDEKIIIERCLKRLSDKEYAVLYGLYYEEKKQTQLAKELGVYKQQINKLRNRAIKQLREMDEIKNIIRSYNRKMPEN